MLPPSRLFIAGLLLLWPIQLHAQDPKLIVLRGPESAEREKLREAADAMTKRLGAVGIDKFLASVETVAGKLAVTLSHETGWSVDARTVIGRMSRCAGQQVRFRFARSLTKVERKRFAHPKAPPGCGWHDVISLDGSLVVNDRVLLRNKPFGTIAKRTARQDKLSPKYPRKYLEFDGLKEMYRQKYAGKEVIYLVLDGLAVNRYVSHRFTFHGHKKIFNRDGTVRSVKEYKLERGRFHLAQKARLLEKTDATEHAVRFPMPFGLKTEGQ